jgi:DNA-binding CsgD family transcriptional regulator
MVGRDAELHELRLLAAGAREGVGGAAVVTGEAGIGKSRLIAEFAAAERAAGMVVVVGHGVDLTGGHLPFATLSESLRDALRQLGVEDLGRLAPEACRTLGSLVPELSAPSELRRHAERGDLTPAPDRVAVLGAAIHLLEAMAARHPVCWVVEDVQWVDPQTLDLLRVMGPAAESRPLVLVTSFRTPVLDPEAAAVLSDLVSRANAHPVRLVRLDEASARRQLRRVVGAELDPAVEDRILSLGEGLPLFVEHLAQEARVGTSSLPESLGAIVDGRLRRLGSRVTAMLEAAAVADGPVATTDLTRVVQAQAAEVDQAVDDAVTARVLEPTEAGRLRFVHALVKELVASRLPPTRRRRLERAWAETLEAASPADLATVVAVAHHRIAAGDAEEALGGFARAARLAARGGDSRLETSCLLRVHELWGAVRDPEAACGMGMVDLIYHLCVAAVAAEQREAVAQVVAAECEGPHLELDAITRLWLTMRLEQLEGRPPGTVGSLRSGEQTTRERATLLLEAPQGLVAMDALQLAGREARRFDGALAARLHRRGWEMARKVGGARARLRSEVFVGFDHLARVEPLAEARRLMSLEDEFAELPLADWSIVLESVVVGLVDAGCYEEATVQAEAALRRLQDPALSPRRYAGIALGLASARVELGDWAEAERWLEVVESSYAPSRAEAAGLRLRIAVRRGPQPELPSYLDRVAPDLDRELDLVGQGHGLADLVAAFYAVGDVDAARRRLDALSGDPRDWWFAAVWPAVNAAARFEVAAQARTTDAVGARLVTRLYALCARFEWVAPAADAFRSEQAALLARSRGTDTVEDWVRAVEAWAGIGRSWDEAVCRVRLAETCSLAGDRDRSVDELRHAHAIACRLGAGPLEREVQVLGRSWGVSLPTVGRTEPRSTLTPLTPLTARERQVLELVADGSTNDDVARILVISPKTASVHVSRILAKLGAGNRTEAVAIARRSGLLP